LASPAKPERSATRKEAKMNIWNISVTTPGEPLTTACLMTSWHLIPGECIKLAGKEWQVNYRIK